jgi:hypothetical protein
MIYANEHCLVEHGRVIEHVNSLDVKRRGPPVACVARLHFYDGRTIERIIDQIDIDIARKTGQNGWKISEGEMWRKTAIHRLAKIVVSLDETTRSAFEENERGAYQSAPAQRTGPRLYAGPKPVELPAEIVTETTSETDTETVTETTIETEEI